VNTEDDPARVLAMIHGLFAPALDSLGEREAA
jgi:hypothetical protein